MSKKVTKLSTSDKGDERWKLSLYITVVGGVEVGKTSLIRSLKNEEYLPRLDWEFPRIQSVSLDVDEVEVKLFIWEMTGAAETIPKLTGSLNSALATGRIQAALLVYDVNDPESMESLNFWHNKLEVLGNGTHILKALVGTKLDLVRPNGKSVLDPKQIRQWQDNKKIDCYFQVSAKTGYNVKNVFTAVIKRTIQFQLVRSAGAMLTRSISSLKKCTLKIIVVGETNVGKTSFIRRVTTAEFSNLEDPTNAIELRKVTLDIDGVEVTLNTWDTAGRDRYLAVANNYYRNADVAIFIYDISSRDTLDSLEYWCSDLELNRKNSTPIKVLIGNKLDASGEDYVTLKEANEFAENREIHPHTFQVSVRTGFNFSEALEKLVKLAVKFQHTQNI
ncbi:Ras-related protein Rab-43 [Halotydeus destructor]|nr:Ras-related protein Rab-43 [Halotydeus destructor]